MNFTNHKKVLIFTLLFGLFYLFFYNSHNPSQNFFIIVFLIIIYYLYSLNQEDIKTQKSEVSSYIINIEKLIKEHDTSEMMLKNVYKIHKPLKDIRFIKSNKDVQDIIYDLRFLLTYDKEDFIDVIIMIEYFLKIHFNIMIDKYDIETHFVILKDIRKEVLNALYSTYFNIPMISTTFDDNDLHKTLKRVILKLQAITYKFIKIVAKKYRDKLGHQTYKGVLAFDEKKDHTYDMVY